MMERCFTTLRNSRKQFVKCVDCGCQTLPHNASQAGTWSAAASLCISGRVNEGVLCPSCANARREILGLPLDASRTPRNLPAAACPAVLLATVKTVRINGQEYRWEIGSLESLVVQWCAAVFPRSVVEQGIKFLLVSVNDDLIRTKDFGSIPIADGDEITIVTGSRLGG